MADYLIRIRALLTKAEGTDNEHEAAAFLAKAHELMIRHSVDEARVRAEGRAGQRAPVTRDVQLAPRSPGYHARQDLLAAVARSLDVHYWLNSGRPGLLTLCGFAEDAEQAEALFTSLLLQMENATVSALARHQAAGGHIADDWGLPRKVHGRTFRVSFMTGYADRVAERLKAIRESSRETVQADSSSAALVLADKRDQVDAWVEQNYDLGRARSYSSTINGSAYSAGSDAGSRASLGGQSVGSGARTLSSRVNGRAWS